MGRLTVSDIVEFIRERLAEDEQWALGVRGVSWEWLWALNTAEELDSSVAVHIARHDPARVLREVEAKRRVLARHHRVPDEVAIRLDLENVPDLCNGCYQTWSCDDVRLLALPYSDHPSYRPEWSPQ
jgi:hypothetical protein